jgi:C-terminal processing protease CtpA/Prc
LVSNQTGSSGEAVVVSFIGNANSILVGTATWGLTTGNGSFSLKDGSQIFLASTVYADRNGRLYHGSIEPDIPVSKMPGDKKIPQEAFDWLEKITGKK